MSFNRRDDDGDGNGGGAMIEMSSRLGMKDVEQGGSTTIGNDADEAPDMGEWTQKRIRSQNRITVIAVGIFLISMAVYVLGGADMFEDNSLVEKYEDESGLVENDFDNEKDDLNQPFNGGKFGGKGGHNPWASHGKGNPFGNQDLDRPIRGHNKTLAREKAREKWSKVHPDKPFPESHRPTNKFSGGSRPGQGPNQNQNKNSKGDIDWNKGFHPHTKDKDKGGKDEEKSNESSDTNSFDPAEAAKSCESSLSQYSDWFNKKITKDDGVQYEIVDQLEHDPEAFTQGLTYANGVLYESAGLYGESTVRILDPDTAKVKKTVDMDPKLFAEGMAYINDELVQITWKSHRGFVYDPETLDIKREFKFFSTKNEGWGITLDECRNQIVVTDGSNNLHIWDPKTLNPIKKIPVIRQNGKPAKELNEIEYWRDRILCNVWYEDVLLVVHPETGVVEKEYDFSELWPKAERKKEHADVFNGISVSADPDILYVTGKLWNRMFRIKLL